MTAVQGGNFWTGFAAGSLASEASSAWSGVGQGQWQGIRGKFAKSGAGMITFGTIEGGAGASLTGGNFWQGALTGMVVSGLNHAMYKIGDPTKKTQYKRPDADGKLILDEVNNWWANDNGEALNVDASKIDVNFIDPSKMVIGKSYLVQTLTLSKDGRVYGRIWITYQGNNQVSILPETYDFNQDGAFRVHPFRNTANGIGRMYVGEGKAYQINSRGLNTINILLLQLILIIRRLTVLDFKFFYEKVNYYIISSKFCVL